MIKTDHGSGDSPLQDWGQVLKFDLRHTPDVKVYIFASFKSNFKT